MLAAIGAGAARHSLSLTGLAVVLQACLGMLKTRGVLSRERHPDAVRHELLRGRPPVRGDVEREAREAPRPAEGAVLPAEAPLEEIRFRGVRFGYGAAGVFDGLDLVLPAGRCTASSARTAPGRPPSSNS